jgi:hypothetical protein
MKCKKYNLSHPNMNFLKINKFSLREPTVKTTPQNVQEANEGLFNCIMTLPAAAQHCGMTQKEMKLTFFEYLKYHPGTYKSEST